jgi:uncharacterized membrane protein YecN with MAPEG domain
MSALTQSTLLGAKVVVSKAAVAKRTNVVTRAGQYDDELLQTAVRPSARMRKFLPAQLVALIFGRKRGRNANGIFLRRI